MNQTSRAHTQSVAQDQDAATKVQQGLRSRVAPRGRYSWQAESRIQLTPWWRATARIGMTCAACDEPMGNAACQPPVELVRVQAPTSDPQFGRFAPRASRCAEYTTSSSSSARNSASIRR